MFDRLGTLWLLASKGSSSAMAVAESLQSGHGFWGQRAEAMSTELVPHWGVGLIRQGHGLDPVDQWGLCPREVHLTQVTANQNAPSLGLEREKTIQVLKILMFPHNHWYFRCPSGQVPHFLHTFLWPDYVFLPKRHLFLSWNGRA